MVHVDQQDISYEAMNFDGLERRGNYRTIAYREDILHALDKKDAAAILYNIISRWEASRKEEILKKIEQRKKAGLTPFTKEQVEDMMWIYMSYNDFVRESGGAVGYNTVVRMIDYLKKEKVFEQRENHDPNYPDYEYRINKSRVRALLKALPPMPAFSPKVPKKKGHSTQMGRAETDESGSTQVGTESTHLGTESTHLGTGVYPDGGTSHITHILHTGYTQRESDDHDESDQNSDPSLTLSSSSSSDLISSSLLIAEGTTPPQEEEPVVVTPIMPPTTMALCPEKIVQITEALVRTRYPQEERPAQLRAAQCILTQGITAEKYIAAFTKRNDEWWRNANRVLKVTHLAAMTERRRMRILEVLDGLQQGESLSGSVKGKSASPPQSSRPITAASFDYSAEATAARDAKNWETLKEKLLRKPQEQRVAPLARLRKAGIISEQQEREVLYATTA